MPAGEKSYLAAKAFLDKTIFQYFCIHVHHISSSGMASVLKPYKIWINFLPLNVITWISYIDFFWSFFNFEGSWNPLPL